MPEINFDVSPITIDRLFVVKARQGKHELTGNQFAAELLEEELKRLCPNPYQNEKEN